MHLSRALFIFMLSLVSAELLAKQADVIVNDEIVPLGILEKILQEHGIEITLFQGNNLDVGELIRRDAEFLIILGGRQSVTRLEPYYFDQIALIRDRTRHDRPTLGLCLGAQLIAVAFGGKVEKGPVAEQGWIELLATSHTDAAVRNLIDSNTKVYASHEDAIVTLPEGAELLARSDLYNHIFRFKKALAIQFHPEATPEITRNWLTLFGRAEDVDGKHAVNVEAFAKNRKGIERFLAEYFEALNSSTSE